MEGGWVSLSPHSALHASYMVQYRHQGYFFIQIALSDYPACHSQHIWMPTIVQDRQILSSSILRHHPSSKSPPPPLFHYNIRSLHSFSKKIIEIHASKAKNHHFTTTSPVVCNFTWEIQKVVFKLHSNSYICICVLEPILICASSRCIIQKSITALL